MSGHPINRRTFIGGVAGIAAARAVFAAPAPDGGRISAGLIGAGGRGNMIAQFIQQHGGYDLNAVADYFPKVAEEAGARFNIDAGRCFSGLEGYKRLLDSGVDTVFLETPPYCFPDHAEAAVAAGCHVYMAKPVACDVPGCLRILEASRKATAGKKAFLVDFQTRTDPAHIEGVARLHKGELGGIGMLASLYTDESFSDPPLTENAESRLRHLIWVNDNGLGAGYLVNAGIHAIDVALWMAGAPPIAASGASRAARPDPHGDSHDVFSLTYEFAGGLILNHRGEHLKNKFEFHCDCVAHCRTGYLKTGYSDSVEMRGFDAKWEGGAVKDLYEAGARRNIATFHENITQGVFDNPTAESGVNSTLAAILGREAAARKTRLTWEQMLAEKWALEADLRGLVL